MNKQQGKVRITMSLPVVLEKKARDQAYYLGFIKNNRGNLSEYIQFLVKNDLEKESKTLTIKPFIINNARKTTVNITLLGEHYEFMKNRAKELGFIRNNSGNIAAYIRFLIIEDISV